MLLFQIIGSQSINISPAFCVRIMCNEIETYIYIWKSKINQSINYLIIL